MSDLKLPEKLQIIDGGPWFLNEPPLKVKHGDPDCPLYREIRNDYNLEEVIASGKTEFDKMLLLKEWVCGNMKKHGWSYNTLKVGRLNFPEILSYIKEGYTFNCTYFTIAMMQCCEAVGFPARRINITRNGAEFPKPEFLNNIGHVVSEVWSNQYGKWIVLDCDVNIHYEKNEIPLSAAEICIENSINQGKSIKPVYGKYKVEMDTAIENMGNGSRKIKGTDMTIEQKQITMKAFRANDVIDYYGFIKVSDINIYTGNDIQNSLSFIPENYCPQIIRNNMPWERKGLWTGDIKDINTEINRTAINIKCIDSKNSMPPLMVELSNNMPGFDHYEFRTEKDTSWRKAENPMVWEINEGISTIFFRAVNKRNITGSEASATILFKL